MYRILKFLLFRLQAERAHHFTTRSLNLAASLPLVRDFIKSVFYLEDQSLERELWGLKFKNPVGLAAGFDKDGKYIRAMSMLGFGFIEVGTVTPRPQKGNPKPRLFRLPKDKAIINRMGFNNEGVDFLVSRLKSLRKNDLIIGGNIGKNKDTPNERAFEDYLICFKKLYPYVDYFVINLSSPNTPGLRELQEKEPLKKILSHLLAYREQQNIKRPILVKIAPDITPELLEDILDLAISLNIDGIVATNTTIDRSGLSTRKERLEEIGNGGLSGVPLTTKVSKMVKQIADNTQRNFPIVGVGGIYSPSTAKERLNFGASLVQLYTGLIYEGPFLVKRIKRHILKTPGKN